VKAAFVVTGMTDGMSIGKRYRFRLKGRTALGALEGVVRSLSLPAGMLGNRDGEHRIWVAGEQFEWFLTPAEIAGFEEVESLSPLEKSTETAPRRSRRAEQPYRGRCLGHGRRSPRIPPAESQSLLARLGARHRRGQ
jgi:hypothetical protein